MNKTLIIILILISSVIILSGCIDSAPAQKENSNTFILVKVEDLGGHYLSVYHDNEYNVTCWKVYKEVSCIPDSQLNKSKP